MRSDKMKYIAFFRGINVGGKNIVKMTDLRQLFVDLNFHNVQTYIQSGNVIFSSNMESDLLISLIEQAFEKQFNFQSTVIIRSEIEIIDIIDSLPFTETEIEQAKNEMPDVEHVYIYFSNDILDTEKIQQLYNSYSGKDRCQIRDREVYLLCFESVRNSKIPALLMKLPQPITARNLKTIKKISTMF